MPDVRDLYRRRVTTPAAALSTLPRKTEVLFGYFASQPPALAAALADRLGFPRALLAERFGVTPACGLAGATPEWARTAVELAQKVADTFADDPDAV